MRLPDLKQAAFLVYVNSLEDADVKVLIIANDDLLLKDNNAYKRLKEKIIDASVPMRRAFSLNYKYH